MQADCVLDGGTMITVPIEVANPSHLQEFEDIEKHDSVLDCTTKIAGHTAVITSPSHLQEFDNKESNGPVVPVEDAVAIYSPQDHRMLEDIQSQFYKKFPPSEANYYANPQALKALVLADAQGRGFNVAIQGSSIVCGKHNPPGRRKKILDLIPPNKKRKIISTRCSCTFKISFTLASRLVPGAPPKAIQITKNSNYLHWNGCLPSQQQLMSNKRSSGVYMKNLLEPQLHTILQLVEMQQAPALILRNFFDLSFLNPTLLMQLSYQMSDTTLGLFLPSES